MKMLVSFDRRASRRLNAKRWLPYGSCMVLGALLGNGDAELLSLVKNKKFRADEVLYVGLQGLHSYPRAFLDEAGVGYEVQSDNYLKRKNRKFRS